MTLENITMTHSSFEKKSCRQSGFTMLELLLVISITSVLFLGITQIMRGWANGEISTGAGQHLQRVSGILQNYIEANFSELTETSDAINDARPEWAAFKLALQGEGLITAGAVRSPLGSDLQISFVKNAGTSRGVIVVKKPMPYKAVLDAARQTGNSGGTLGAFPNNTSAYGAFGQWSVPVAQLMPGGGAVPCTPTTLNSCLVAIISYNDTTLCGSYLYRNATTCANGNTMMTNLNMSNHDITGANRLITNDLAVSDTATMGETTIAGTTTLDGPATAASGIKVAGGDLTVSGNANFANNVTMGGNLNVVNINAYSIQSDRVETNQLHAEDLNITNGTLAIDSDLTVNGNVNVSGPGAEVLAPSINAGLINAGGGDITVGTVNVQNNMQIMGQVNVIGGALVADHLVVEKCAVVAGDSYGTCP